MITYFIEKIRKGYLGIILVFSTSVLITLLFLTILPAKLMSIEVSDFLNFYNPVAHNLLNGYGLIDDKGAPAVRYPPGYPIILAGIFQLAAGLHISENIILHIFSILCMGLAAVFIFLMAKLACKSESALLAAIGFMTYPFALWLTRQPHVEMPFLVTLYASLWFFMLAIIRQKGTGFSAFLSGLLLGMAMLIKPIAIGLPLILSIMFLVLTRNKSTHQRLALIALMLAGIILVIGPWEGWLYARTGKILLLSSGGLPSIRDGLTFGIEGKGYRQGIPVPADVKALMYHFYGLRIKLDSIGSILQAGLEQMKERPVTIIKFAGIKAARSWYGTDSQKFEMPILFIQALYFSIFLLGTIISFYRRNVFRWLSLSVWILVIYFWVMTMIVLPLLRYMVPAIGLLFLLLPLIFEKKFGDRYPTKG